MTPSSIGVGEREFNDRDLSYTKEILKDMLEDEAHGEENKQLMQEWLAEWGALQHRGGSRARARFHNDRTSSNRCGVTMSAGVEGNAIAALMDEKEGVEVTKYPATIRIDDRRCPAQAGPLDARAPERCRTPQEVADLRDGHTMARAGKASAWSRRIPFRPRR